MIKGNLPPKTPAPQFEIISHHHISFSWSFIIERLPFLLPADFSNCVIELSMKKINNFDEQWIVKYIGSNDTCEIEGLDADCMYHVKIRLRNKVGWGPYSDEIELTTPKEPVTGDDFHRAIIMDDDELLSRLLETGLVKLNTPNRFDHTPLMACVMRNLEKLLNILLDHNIDLDVQNKAGKTALMLAASKGNGKMVKMLLKKGAKATIKDRLGMTALFYAVDVENHALVRILIEAGCNVNDMDNENNWTPLIRLAVLANNGNVKVGQVLLQSGANVNHQDIFGNTTLIHCCFHNNHVDLAKLLINYKANLYLKNKTGNCAYQIAKSMNNTGVLSLLEDAIRKAS